MLGFFFNEPTYINVPTYVIAPLTPMSRLTPSRRLHQCADISNHAAYTNALHTSPRRLHQWASYVTTPLTPMSQHVRHHAAYTNEPHTSPRRLLQSAFHVGAPVTRAVSDDTCRRTDDDPEEDADEQLDQLNPRVWMFVTEETHRPCVTANDINITLARVLKTIDTDKIYVKSNSLFLAYMIPF